MKLNLRVSNIRNQYDYFNSIFSKLIDEDIDIQITVHQVNPQTDQLIHLLDYKNFLNLDHFYKIPLYQFSDIFKYDEDIQYELKQYISQKNDTQFSWFIQDQYLITHIDCQYQVQQFLDKLFYCQTQFQCYVDYMNTHHQIKIFPPQDELSLKSSKQSIQKNYNYQKLYTIYGYKKQFNNQDVFAKKVVRHEHYFAMHNVFIEQYVPIIKQWIEKYLYTYVEVRRGQQILDLYGPHHLVKKAEEILMSEYSALNHHCGILKFKELDDESIQLMQIHDILIQNYSYDYEITKQNSLVLDELENSLKIVKSKIFCALLVIDFRNSQLCNNAKFYFNFDFDRKNVEIQLENEIYQLAQNQVNGKAISYFVIIYGNLQHSIFLKKLNEDLQIIKEVNYNNNQINYLRSLKTDELQILQNKYQIKLKFDLNCVIILGKKQSIAIFNQFLIKNISQSVEIVDYYYFKNRFSFNSVFYDHQQRFQNLTYQYQCQSCVEQQELKIQITSKDSIKILQFKSQLQQLEYEIDKSKNVVQISIEKPINININQLIQQISSKFPSVEINLGLNDRPRLEQVVSFSQKQTTIKVYFGSLHYLCFRPDEVFKLKNIMILLPIEKINNQSQHVEIQWLEELIYHNNLTLVNQKQNSFYEVFQYQHSFQHKESGSNQLYKEQQEIIQLNLIHIYYRDLLKPQNFIHYFDKQNINKSYRKVINEIKILMPKAIIIANLIEKNGSELQELLDYLQQSDFPKIQISLITNEKNDMNQLKSQINRYFEEDNQNISKKTYHISITSNIQDNLNQVIKQLNEI